jgi:dihydrodipicolinate synthase/N-acetylneuraminate lyase
MLRVVTVPIVPGRKVVGISALLLPYRDGMIDWAGFEAHLCRTLEAGLIPAVNMDTGYVQALSPQDRADVLRRTAGITAGATFVAGAYVQDQPASRFTLGAHLAATEEVTGSGGVPVIFPSFGLATLSGPEVVAAHEAFSQACDRFIAFELSPAFHPAGRIWDIETFGGVVAIETCTGVKHSSLRRAPEWERLTVRDTVRPGFRVYSGNDLAIDMVMYGSDYLLGLSTVAPDAFARRDALWAAGDPAFGDLNDALQAIGSFMFRAPVPAYRHSVAQMLHLRGHLTSTEAGPCTPRRPASDVDVLRALWERVEALT